MASVIKKELCAPPCETVPIISIGNITVGGSGKTPLLIALAGRYQDVAVILRGYGRKSRGLLRVSRHGKIECDVEQSGDEAMVIARSLPNASVWVCEDRAVAVTRAKEEGARVIFLDDGFGHCLMKYDILIDTDPPNPLCLPSGPYRLPRRYLKRADLVVREGRDFRRKVKIAHPTCKMVLLTAIANPQRLDPFLPEGVTARYTFCDHHYFSEAELAAIWQKEQPESFLVTQKDAVKLERFGYPLTIMELRVFPDLALVRGVDEYIQKGFYAKKAANCPHTP
jgi:tetraacyldisaccharide 4'-kinase